MRPGSSNPNQSQRAPSLPGSHKILRPPLRDLVRDFPSPTSTRENTLIARRIAAPNQFACRGEAANRLRTSSFENGTPSPTSSATVASNASKKSSFEDSKSIGTGNPFALPIKRCPFLEHGHASLVLAGYLCERILLCVSEPFEPTHLRRPNTSRGGGDKELHARIDQVTHNLRFMPIHPGAHSDLQVGAGALLYNLRAKRRHLRPLPLLQPGGRARRTQPQGADLRLRDQAARCSQ